MRINYCTFLIIIKRDPASNNRIHVFKGKYVIFKLFYKLFQETF